MGTIVIKNLSSLKDIAAVKLVFDFWVSKDETSVIRETLNVGIKKKGHTFTVFDLEKEKDRRELPFSSGQK